MKSKLSSEAYTSPDWFEKEREYFFRPLWQFVGFKMMLEKENSFITKKILGVSIVVQNLSGKIKAFENVCAHRNNLIQTDIYGVRPLICRYHGWSYDNDGRIKNIPFEEDIYRYPKSEKACLQLKEFRVEIVGNLIFINLSDNNLSIQEQFNNEMLDALTEVSNAFDGEVLIANMPGDYNWKLIYENLRDPHHPRYLHSESLYRGVKFSVLMDEVLIEHVKKMPRILNKSDLIENLRSFSAGGLDAPMEKLISFPWHSNVLRYGSKDWYYNWLVFPNLHIASGTGGYSFIVEHHVPVAANKTDLNIYYVTSKKRKKFSSSAAVLFAHLQGAEIVLKEDITVLENIQKGFNDRSQDARLGDYELMNFKIQNTYLALMEGLIDL